MCSRRIDQNTTGWHFKPKPSHQGFILSIDNGRVSTSVDRKQLAAYGKAFVDVWHRIQAQDGKHLFPGIRIICIYFARWHHNNTNWVRPMDTVRVGNTRRVLANVRFLEAPKLGVYDLRSEGSGFCLIQDSGTSRDESVRKGFEHTLINNEIVFGTTNQPVVKRLAHDNELCSLTEISAWRDKRWRIASPDPNGRIARTVGGPYHRTTARRQD